MPILNRAQPNQTRFYVESANAKALTIRNLGHFTAHIYCLQIKAGMCCSTFQLERLWLRVRSIPGKPFPGGDRRALETLDFEGKYQPVKSGPCLKHASLRTYPMPSRTIEESHRPRVSDRTMHCHSSSGQPSSLLFQKTMGAVTTAKWNHRKEELILRLACRDEPKPFTWARPLSD